MNGKYITPTLHIANTPPLKKIANCLAFELVLKIWFFVNENLEFIHGFRSLESICYNTVQERKLYIYLCISFTDHISQSNVQTLNKIKKMNL